MKFCQNCGKEVLEDAKFCASCGTMLNEMKTEIIREETIAEENAAIEEQEVFNENVSYKNVAQEIYAQPIVPVTYTVVKPKKSFKKFFTKKLLIIVSVILVAAIATGAIIFKSSSEKAYKNDYNEKLTEVYQTMSEGAEMAEDYCSLQSKVWRNCIYEESSSETDKYTKNEYGWFYSDFNDALRSFYDGEFLTYALIETNVETVDNLMSELKDCPEEFEEEYKSVKEMYVVFSDLTDLAVGDSNYSWNTFTDALERLKADFKSAESTARLLVG